jgi:hypothetical protein
VSELFGTREAVFIPVAFEESSFLSNIIYYVDYYFIVFMSIVGIIAQLNRDNETNSVGHMLALGALFTLPFYIPAISDLFSPLLGYRFPLQVSPFVAFAAGAGTSIFIQKWKSDNKYKGAITIFSLMLLIGFFFLSTSLSAKFIDFDMLPDLLGKENRGYFTQAELDSFNFYSKYKEENGIISSDYQSSRYLDGYLNLNTSFPPDIFNPNSYFLFRSDEYRSSGKLKFEGPATTVTSRIEENKYPIYIWPDGHRVYSNGPVYIYKK